MNAIRGEIDRVGAGEWTVEDNPLRGAPHTAGSIAAQWDHPYSREIAVLPAWQGSPRRCGRPSVVSTVHMATATWSAPARRSKRSQATKACARRRSPPLAYEFENSDLRRGADAYRRTPSPGATRRVQHCVSDPVQALHRRLLQRNEIPQRPHLTAVSVPGQLQIDTHLGRLDRLTRFVPREARRKYFGSRPASAAVRFGSYGAGDV